MEKTPFFQDMQQLFCQKLDGLLSEQGFLLYFPAIFFGFLVILWSKTCFTSLPSEFIDSARRLVKRPCHGHALPKWGWLVDSPRLMQLFHTSNFNRESDGPYFKSILCFFLMSYTHQPLYRGSFLRFIISLQNSMFYEYVHGFITIIYKINL